MSVAALIAFLERHHETENVALCLDADTAGQEAAKKIQRQLAADERFSNNKVTINPPIYSAKDYNEMLVLKITSEREEKNKTQNRTGDLYK